MRRRAIRPVKDLVKTKDSSSQDMTKVNNLRSNPQDETSYIHDEERTDQVDKRDEACVKRECTYTDRGKGLHKESRVRSCDQERNKSV